MPSKRTRRRPMSERSVSEAGLRHLKRTEGWSQSVYFDSTGHLTAGWGTRVDDKTTPLGRPYQAGDLIPVETLEGWFKEDVAEFEGQLKGLAGSSPATQHEYEAWLSMIYNLGAGGIANTRTLQAQLDGDHEAVRRGMMTFNKERDGRGNLRVSPGLTKRRAADVAWYSTPDVPPLEELPPTTPDGVPGQPAYEPEPDPLAATTMEMLNGNP